MNTKNPIWEAKDGAVNPEVYKNEKIKILWVLKEPNGKDFDFAEYLKDPRKYPKWKRSYGLIVKTSAAIFNNLPINQNSYPYPNDIPELMSRIALVNIKKTGGLANANHDEIMEYAKENMHNLKKQISELFPDLIIYAGTICYVTSDLTKNIKDITHKEKN